MNSSQRGSDALARVQRESKQSPTTAFPLQLVGASFLATVLYFSGSTDSFPDYFTGGRDVNEPNAQTNLKT